MSADAKKHKIILAVFVNRIGFGFTAFEDGMPVDWGAKDLRRRAHANGLVAFRTLLAWYRPCVVVMREYHRDRTHRGERAKALLRSMRAAARRRGTAVHRVSRQSVQECFAGVDAKNKYDVACEIVKRFPEFEDRLPRKRRLWESEEYGMGIFDAAAIALTYLSQQRQLDIHRE